MEEKRGAADFRALHTEKREMLLHHRQRAEQKRQHKIINMNVSVHQLESKLPVGALKMGSYGLALLHVDALKAILVSCIVHFMISTPVVSFSPLQVVPCLQHKGSSDVPGIE